VTVSEHASGTRPLVLTVEEDRRGLRIGRRQLYQAVGRRELDVGPDLDPALL